MGTQSQCLQVVMPAEQKAPEPAMWLPGLFLASHLRTGKRSVMHGLVNFVAELSARNTHVVVQFHLQFSRQKGKIRVLNFSFNIRRLPAYVPVLETSLRK